MAPSKKKKKHSFIVSQTKTILSYKGIYIFFFLILLFFPHQIRLKMQNSPSYFQNKTLIKLNNYSVIVYE